MLIQASTAAALGVVSWAKGLGVVDAALLPDGRRERSRLVIMPV
jgi:hypothetical protein